MLIVQICDFGDDGTAHYRLHEPSRFLGQLSGVTVVDCHYGHRFLPALAAAADVLIVQFLMDWELPALCARRRAAGRVTVFEANDYLFELQPWNPIAPQWQDRAVGELYGQLLRAADGVQTTTPELARRWRLRGAREVAVFPNQLAAIPPLLPPPERPLTVGWGGSPGHFADWYALAPGLGVWLAAHPDIHLAVMTSDFARSFFLLPPERYHFTPFGSRADYFRFLSSLDIGLAPLLPTDYNRCRSDVKFLEYAAAGVAGIYADLEPYRGCVVPGETGFLYRTPADLAAGLDRLCADAELRQQIRRRAYESLGQRLLADHIGQRLAWYQDLLRARPSSTPLPAEVVEAAVREGGYLQLRPAEPEQLLLDALKQPAPAAAAPALANLLQQHPRYLAALQSLGQLLNDQRDHRGALAYLEQARLLDPDSARTWSEIGRAWYRLDDEARARAALEEAVRLNPSYLTAWQYLLRLLGLSRSPDGPRWAQRAAEQFPSCYTLALLGAQTYPPADAVGVLLGLLDRYGPTFTPAERAPAAAAFRPAILAAVQAAPAGADSLALLRRACQVFPDSARLASELGFALCRAGLLAEAGAHHARALALRRQAALYREEFSAEEAPHLYWQFGEHLRLAPEGDRTETD